MSYKLFSHRGFLDNLKLKGNTLKSFQNALNNNFDAIELDIWYIKNQFILGHDQPAEKLSEYDKLEDLFKKFGNVFTYWIDFKNLKAENSNQALKDLKQIIDKHKINYNQLLFVPCLDNINLDENLFAYQAIRDNFGKNCNLGAFVRKIKKEDLQQYYQNLKAQNIRCLSIKFNNIDEYFMDIFHDINLLAWTVNEEEDLNNLIKLGVENIATDLIKPK